MSRGTETRTPRRHAGRGALAWALVANAAIGCGTTKVTGTARTGTEQILLTNAWDEALAKVDFRPLTGVPVYLDTSNATAVDQGWVVSSMRQAMLAQGVLLRAKPEQAQWIVEARIGAYGTDEYNYLVGINQTTIPATVTGIPTGTIPKIQLAEKNDQHATAKLALFAYDKASGRLTWSSGTSLAVSSAKDVYVGGFGPIQSGTIRPGSKLIGVQLPIISDPVPYSNTPREVPPSASSAIRIPTNQADIDAFAPGP